MCECEWCESQTATYLTRECAPNDANCVRQRIVWWLCASGVYVSGITDSSKLTEWSGMLSFAPVFECVCVLVIVSIVTRRTFNSVRSFDTQWLSCIVLCCRRRSPCIHWISLTHLTLSDPPGEHWITQTHIHDHVGDHLSTSVSHICVAHLWSFHFISVFAVPLLPFRCYVLRSMRQCTTRHWLAVTCEPRHICESNIDVTANRAWWYMHCGVSMRVGSPNCHSWLLALSIAITPDRWRIYVFLFKEVLRKWFFTGHAT